MTARGYLLPLARLLVPLLAVVCLSLAVPDVSHCDPLVTGSQDQWQALTASGWHGDATDGIEAIYPPDCHVRNAR